MKSSFLIAFSFILIVCSDNNNRIKTGADVLISDSLDLVKSRNLGIITNHTGKLASGVHLVDALKEIDDVHIIALFGPEHGIRGDAPDGQSIGDGIDGKTGLKVYSLYGKTRKPTPEMLKDIDLLVFDIQDIGARFYTYISTMYYSLQAASENKIPIIVLDRPNPISGNIVEGPILDPEFKSFVGIAEIPIRHGMTVGELAHFFNREGILNSEHTADLHVVKMQNWKREYYFDDCGLNWIKPSPNIPTLETAIVYPGLCLLEATNISEGRGTLSPFINIGSPYTDSQRIIDEITKLGIGGISTMPVTYTPVEIPDMSKYPKYKNEKCYGIEIKITDRKKFRPIDFAISLIYLFNKFYPNEFSIKESRMGKLWGNSNLTKLINSGSQPAEIIQQYRSDLKTFNEQRKLYLLYN